VYPGFKPTSFPAVPGIESVARIDTLGTGVSNLSVGQRVVPCYSFGNTGVMSGHGSWREYGVIKADYCIPVPDDVPDEFAAQLIVNPFTVVSMIRELEIPRGQYLIQSAAGSTLGRMVIQLANHWGLKTINLVRRSELVAELKALGADHVLNTQEETDIPARVREITGGNMAYAGIDAVAGDLMPQLTGSIRNDGTLFLYGAMSDTTFKGSVNDCIFRGVTIEGFWITPRFSKAGMDKNRETAAEIFRLMADGVMTPNTGTHYDVGQLDKAIAESKGGARNGKVLITF
jgi:trans-2-enoyl-CoA reductase